MATNATWNTLEPDIMSEAIIVLNAGSSSLKFSIYRVADPNLDLAARGQIEGLGTSPRFTAKDHQGRKLAEASMGDTANGFGHPEALRTWQWAREQFAGELLPVAVGHRMAHGGLEFIKPTLIDGEVVKKLEQLIPLVPLHQPHNLAAVKGVTKLRPDLPQVACFDTAFHRTKPKVADRFGLPDEMFQAVRGGGVFMGCPMSSSPGSFGASPRMFARAG